MADIRGTSALALEPVVCEQNPAAPGGEPVDLKRFPAISCLLQQAFAAQTKKIGMELVAMAEGQAASDLMGIMPASISERFEHQALQFSVLPHNAILPVFVSTLVFVMGTRKEAKKTREKAKACTLHEDPARSFARNCSRFFSSGKVVSNAQNI